MFDDMPTAFAGPPGDASPSCALARPVPASRVYFVAGRIVSCAQPLACAHKPAGQPALKVGSQPAADLSPA